MKGVRFDCDTIVIPLQTYVDLVWSATLVVAAGVALVRVADRLSTTYNLQRLLVGSIVLATATSLPELLINRVAVQLHQPDLAVGDLLGSSLLNLLILAVLDTLYRHPRRTFTGEFQHHAQSAVLSINLTAIIGAALVSRLSIEVAGVNILLWVAAIVYLIGFRFTVVAAPSAPPGQRSRIKLRAAIGIAAALLGATAVIALAAPFMVRAIDTIAVESGLGRTFVGTTLVALATSLPELVTTATAFRIGATDLALGNIFGSNTFNMILFVPSALWYDGSLLRDAQPDHALTAFGVVIVASVAVMGQISRRHLKPRLWEPSSALVIVLSLALLYLVYLQR